MRKSTSKYQIARHYLLASGLFLWTCQALAGKETKMDICHWDATQQKFFVINVSSNAIDKHFQNHGDSFPAQYWSDVDHDGFGNNNGTVDVCPQIGLVGNANDCNDTNAAVNPAQSEVAYNGLDDDCNTATPDNDLDNDGYNQPEDCDDSNTAINPGMSETSYNGLDDDCNATTPDDDLDSDGFVLADDCNDQVATINPSVQDSCGDSVDNNCDGMTDENCTGACPCFNADNIQMAYEAYLANNSDYAEHYAQCYDYDYGYYYYGYNAAGVYFINYTYNYPEYRQAGDEFYSYGYDDYYYYNYCASYSYDYDYNYDTGYSNYEQYTYNYLAISPEEQQACEDVIMQWAASVGINCSVWSY